MTDREKVIKGLKCCSRVEPEVCERMSCPYVNGHRKPGRSETSCMDKLMRDALALLKAQEPRDAIVVLNGIGMSGGWWFQCPSCKMEIEPRDRYCKSCGQAVKWE